MKNEGSTYKDVKRKEYPCSGCGIPISRYVEKCPSCERANPHYLVKK